MTARQNAWVLASRIAPQLGGVVLLVLGARFLDPATLGSFVLIFAWIELLRRLTRAGWREAVILDADAAATPTILTLALLASAAAFALAALSALALHHLAPWLTLCTLLLGTSLLPLAPSVIWEGILLRRQQTELEARAVIAAEIVHLALAALLLAAGLGILALALARIARALTAFAALGRAAGWPFALSADWPQARALLPVSAHVTLASLINFVTTYGVDLIVGLFLGPASVAFYRIGSRIAGGVADVLNETVRVLGWSSLPTPRPGETPADRARRIAAFFARTVELTAPVFAGLALTASPLVLLLMGEGWEPAAFVTALMAIARLLQVPATVAWPALAAVGRTAELPRLAFAVSGSALACTLLLGPFGLAAVVWGQVAAALLAGAATMLLVNRAALAGAPLSLRPDLLLGLALMAAAVTLAGAAPLPLGPSFAAQIAAGAAAYAGFLRWRRPTLWAEIADTLRAPAPEAPR